MSSSLPAKMAAGRAYPVRDAGCKGTCNVTPNIWFDLAPPWTRGEFAARLRTVGVGVVPSDAFALAPPPEAVRLGLGAPASHQELERSLRIVADLTSQSPALSTLVV